MVTAVARKPMKNLTLIICRKVGEVSRKSKETVSRLLNSCAIRRGFRSTDETASLEVKTRPSAYKESLPFDKEGTERSRNFKPKLLAKWKAPLSCYRKILSSHPTVHCTQLRYPPSSVQSKIRIFLSELKSCYIFANTASGGL